MREPILKEQVEWCIVKTLSSYDNGISGAELRAAIAKDFKLTLGPVALDVWTAILGHKGCVSRHKPEGEKATSPDALVYRIEPGGTRALREPPPMELPFTMRHLPLIWGGHVCVFAGVGFKLLFNNPSLNPYALGIAVAGLLYNIFQGMRLKDMQQAYYQQHRKWFDGDSP